MTRLEAIKHLMITTDDSYIQIMSEKLTDEMILKDWNHLDQMDSKGLRLVKKDDEFIVEFYMPLCEFFKEAWKNTQLFI